jgi:iron complex outermembrane receptor protein
MKKKLILSLIAINLLAQDNEVINMTITSTKLTDTQLNSSSSVEIVNSDSINNLNINSIDEITNSVSNIDVSGIGNRSDKTFSFRGVSNYVGYESSIAMYLDSTPIPMSYGYGAIDFNNIDFIEVLKGPQGTLFGKNAESGIINIFTKKPTKKFTSEISIDKGQYNTQNLYAKISGPIKDTKLKYSFSLSKNSSDGFSKNILTNSNFDTKDLFSYSLKFDYDINNQQDIKLNYTKIKVDDGGSPFKVNTTNNPFEIDNEPQNDFMKMENDFASLIYTNQFGASKIVSTTTYANQKMNRQDYVGILGGLVLDFDVDVEEISQELRFSYNQYKYDFLAGLFYSKKLKFDYNENQDLKALNLVSNNSLENIDDNKALFLQGRYWLNSNYNISLGGRLQQISRDFSRDLTKFDTSNLVGSDETTWNHFTPMVSLNYVNDIDEYNVYATYSQGYRPGGYNYRQETDVLTSYDEETTKSYEIGYKLNKTNLKIDSAVFYNNIINHRINTFTDNLGTITLNAQKAYSYGAEFGVTYAKDRLKVFQNIGITKSKIKEYNENKALEGTNLMDVPQITATVGLEYFFTNNYFVNTNIKHVGKKYYNQENSTHTPSYEVTNLSLGYKTKDMTVSLYSKNLFDKRYTDFMISTPTNDYYHFGAPRVVGIKLTKKF